MRESGRKYARRGQAVTLLTCVLFVLGLTSCGGASVEQLEIPETAFTEEVPVVSGEIGPEELTAEIEARRQRGDTVAIDHKQLKKLLPTAIPGYKLDIDKSTTFETKNYKFSEATHVFYDSKEEYIEFIAGDYVADPDFFKVNLQRYNLAQGVEIEGVREEKRIINGFVPAQVAQYFTWSLYNKDRGIARVYVGVNYRYFVTIEATGQAGFLNLEKVKNWLKWGAVVPE